MTRDTHRAPVPDRARRRAIRAYAARFGVTYSVAARLLRAQISASTGRHLGDPPALAKDHRAWLFALRESRRFELRVRDTRLAADLPLGRATHLTERFPPLRNGALPLYTGDGRQTVLGLLYAVVAVESPASVPGAEERAWVAELGEETAVDAVCAALDRTARLLLDQASWRLWPRVETALATFLAGSDRRARDAAVGLDRQFRSTVLRGSLDGARHILDAVLAAAVAGHPPGTRVRVTAGPLRGHSATVVGVRWSADGPPTGYDLHAAGVTVTVGGADVTVPDERA
jgi:hypothetical protein